MGNSSVSNVEILLALWGISQFTYQRFGIIKKIDKVVKGRKWQSERQEGWGNSNSKGGRKNSGANVGFAEIEGDSP